MRTPGFWPGAAAALLLSAAGAVIFAAIGPLVGQASAARLVVSALGLAYVLLLLCYGRARVGRVVTLVAWLCLAALLSIFDPTLWLWLAAQVGAVWLVRCLYLHDSLLAALADALLNGLALAAATAVGLHTGSVFLTLWSFFLVQAVFVFIPKAAGTPHEELPDGEGFEEAYRTAEAALRRLSTKP